jgi:putative chitinase
MTPFDFEFTLDHASEILKHNDQVEYWYIALCDNLPTFDIYNKERVAAFLSQTCHESANYTMLHENLNYRAESLIKTWPNRFNGSNAGHYAHNPERIANKVYSDRMGNGTEMSGEGWRYRGRGPIQITGKDNYRACSMAVYGDTRLLDNPELLEEDMDVAVKSACWFWNSRNLNELADEGNIKEITRKINGGYNGLEDRESKYTMAMTILQE